MQILLAEVEGILDVSKGAFKVVCKDEATVAWLVGRVLSIN